MIEFSKIKYHLAGNRESNAKLEEFFKLKKILYLILLELKKDLYPTNMKQQKI